MIDTERLKLLELSHDDCEFIVELLNEPSFKRFIGDKRVNNLADARSYLTEGPISHYEQHGFGLYRASMKDGDTPIGMCGLVKRDEFPDPDLGFAFLEAHWSKGYAYESSVAVLDYARDDLRLNRIIAMADGANESSIRLLEKLGFRYEQMVTMPGETEAIRQYAIGY